MAAILSFSDYLDDDTRSALGLGDSGWRRLESLLDGAAGLGAVLAHREELGPCPLPALAEIATLHRRYQKWREVARAAGLPAELTRRTRHPHQIAALVRFRDRLGEAAPLGDWLELWNAAFALTLKRGEARAEPAAPLDDPRLGAIVDRLGAAAPAEVTPHRWLGWRRAERDEVVTVRIALPLEAIRDQLSIRPSLAASAAHLGELVLVPLPAAIRLHLDEQAEAEARRTAALGYRALLEQPPLDARRITAIFVGSAQKPLGLVHVAPDGQLTRSLRLGTERGFEARLDRFIAEEDPDVIVLPTGAPDHVRLEALRRRLRRPTAAVRPAGLSEARRALPAPAGEQSLPAEVASALVLARRALTPFAAFGAIDPVALGLAEYQQDLDEEELRRRLVEERLLIEAQRREGTSASIAAAVRPTARIINPLVRSPSDLRPGMVVSAVVTNLAPFGAFVTLGLAEEGLIHVSELANHFVRDPAEIVRVGDELRARVLGVDPERGRISLSLRTPPEGKTPRGAPGGKGKALAELEKLFRK